MRWQVTFASGLFWAGLGIGLITMTWNMDYEHFFPLSPSSQIHGHDTELLKKLALENPDGFPWADALQS
jgi:hypothetical protein